LKYFLLFHLFVPIGYYLFRLWRSTLRIEYHNREQLDQAYGSGQGIIFAFWHGDLFGAACAGIRENKKRPIYILTSKSRDGELLTRFLQKNGLGTVRGSSSKGALGGFLNLHDKLKTGENTALTLDGPRGPRYDAKPGAIMLAKTSGALIIPGAIRYSLRVKLKSWDRCEIPLPFSRCLVRIGSPVAVARNADRNEMEMIRKSLEKNLQEMKGTRA
jgi:hypothetical protein